MHAGVHTPVCVCVCTCMLESGAVSVAGRKEAFWTSLGSRERPPEQTTCAFSPGKGFPAARPCCGVSCSPGCPGIPRSQSWEESKGCGAAAPRGSVAKDGTRQLVGQRVPALDFLVLVLQAVEPVLQPLPFGINS